VVEISPLGLVEMTRQNVTDGVREILTKTCPTCEGEGVVLSEESVALGLTARIFSLQFGFRLGISPREAEQIFSEAERMASKAGDLRLEAPDPLLVSGVLERRRLRLDDHKLGVHGSVRLEHLVQDLLGDESMARDHNTKDHGERSNATACAVSNSCHTCHMVKHKTPPGYAL
jgi:hypothetical protein